LGKIVVKKCIHKLGVLWYTVLGLGAAVFSIPWFSRVDENLDEDDK